MHGATIWVRATDGSEFLNWVKDLCGLKPKQVSIFLTVSGIMVEYDLGNIPISAAIMTKLRWGGQSCQGM